MPPEALSLEQRRMKNRMAQAERRRSFRLLGLCICGKPRRSDKKSCQWCYDKGLARQGLSTPSPTPPRARVVYPRIQVVMRAEELADYMQFCEEHHMSLDVLFHEAVEAYVEGARLAAVQEERTRLARQWDEMTSEVMRSYSEKDRADYRGRHVGTP